MYVPFNFQGKILKINFSKKKKKYLDIFFNFNFILKVDEANIKCIS